MKVLIDMNLTPLWVPFLVAHGFEATHWSAIGASDAPDSVILEHAESNGMVVLTHDLDFGALLAHRKSKLPSVIQVRMQDVMPQAMGELLIRAIKATAEYLEAGALVTVNATQNRIRVLPI